MPTRALRTRVRRMAFGVAWVMATMLLAAPAALAEKSGYESVGVPGDPGSTGSSLPFTGFDLAAAAAVGLAVLLIGIGLWHLGGRDGEPGPGDAS